MTHVNFILSKKKKKKNLWSIKFESLFWLANQNPPRGHQYLKKRHVSSFFFFSPWNHLYLTPRRGKETGKVTVTLQKKRKRKAYLTTLTSQQNYENATSYPTRPLAYPYPYVLWWTKTNTWNTENTPIPFLSLSLSLSPPRFMPYISLSFHHLYSLSLSLSLSLWFCRCYLDLSLSLRASQLSKVSQILSFESTL